MADAPRPDPSLPGKVVAELVGTFALVYVGVLVLHHGAAAGLTGVALAHGLAIAVMVSATMTVSGGHLNPAVTIGALVGGHISGRNALAYVMAQLAGGAVAALLASLSLDGADISSGIPALADGVSAGHAILIEAILTFFLVFVVYGTGIDGRFGGRIGGLAIGLTVTLDILAGGPLTGGAMNPARWFGPAVALKDYSDALVYTVGPILGGVLAGLTYSKFLAAEKR